MRVALANLLRVAVIGDMLRSVEKRLKGYFRVEFQPHVLEKLDLGKAVGSELSGYNDMIQLKILDEFSEYIVTGKFTREQIWRKTENQDNLEKSVMNRLTDEEKEKMTKKELTDYIEKSTKHLNETDKMWRAGFGYALEDKLRGLIWGKLGNRGLLGENVVPIDFRDSVVLNILRKERSREFEANEYGEKEIWNKIEPEVLRYTANFLREKMKDSKKRTVLLMQEEAPMEVLEPGVKEKDEGSEKVKVPPKERVDPSILKNDWFDYDEIMAWVDKMFSDPEKLIFYNALLEPKEEGFLNDKELVEKLEKDFGKKVELTRGIGILRRRLMERVRDKFFIGSGLRMKKELEEEKKERGEAGTLHELSDSKLKDFEEYLDNELTRPSSTGGITRTPSKIKLILQVVKELTSKDKEMRRYKSIADRLGIKDKDVENIVLKDIKPHFNKWLSRRKKMAGIWELLWRAGRSAAETEEELFDSLAVGEDEDVSDIGDEPVATPPKDLSPSKVPVSVPRGDEVKIYHDKKPEDQKKTVESFNRLIQRIIKTPEKEKPFKVRVGFVSKYDWDDVGRSEGKIKPERDVKGTWLRDDPEFAWKTFSISMEHRSKSTSISYYLNLSLTPDGEFPKSISPKDSHLLVEVTRRNKVSEIKEPIGSPSVFRKVLDDYFLDLRNLGLPIEGEIGIGKGHHPVSVNYYNENKNKVYKGTVRFKDKMGGLAKSNQYHLKKVEDYNLFLKKLEEKQTGAEGMLIDKTPGQLRTYLKNILVESHVTEKLRDEAKEWLKKLENIGDEIRNREEMEIFIKVKDFIKNFMRWEDEYHKGVEETRAKAEKEKIEEEKTKELQEKARGIK